MSQRVELLVTVAVAAVAAAGVVVGITLQTRNTPHQPVAQTEPPPVPKNLPKPWGPPIEKAFRDWPDGSIDTMQRLGLKYPKNARVQLYRGIALLWAGYPSDAQSALESAKKLGRDTIVQVQADNLLHPAFFQPTTGPSYPIFQPTRPNPLLERGSQLQVQGHQISAERLYQQAARKNPNDDEAQVAAAVGLFDEDNLTPAFSRLGPLTQRFPRSQSVRYYLGYLLAWTGQRDASLKQFKKVVALGPDTELGKAAGQFVARISAPGTAAGAG
jgi:tetratricopeptide (TPR) repeat protein